MSYEELQYLSMSYGTFPPLGSIAAVRPVFLIVMGVFLMVIAWRLVKNTSGWSAWTMISGALLLGFGYSIMLPLYEAGLIDRLSSHGDQSTAMGWHAVKIFTMNGGWLLFGIGLAIYANVFASPSPTPRRTTAIPPASPHEFTT